MFPVVLHKLHKGFNLAVSASLLQGHMEVTGGRVEPRQSIFSGACSGPRQAAGQRQFGVVVFLAGGFAAFQAISEQLPLSADDFFFPFPFSSPSLLSTASLKLSASP